MSAIVRLDEFVIDRVAQPLMDIVHDAGMTTAQNLGRFILLAAVGAALLAGFMGAVGHGGIPLGVSALSALSGLVSASSIWRIRNDIRATRPGMLPPERASLLLPRLAWFFVFLLALALQPRAASVSLMHQSWVATTVLAWVGLVVASCRNHPGASHRRKMYHPRGLTQGA